jgi:uncharacterized coiled-coil protein SlyX
MSAADRIAALEAQVQENDKEIEVLSHTNWLLNNYSTQQEAEVSKFEEDFQRLYPELVDNPNPAALESLHETPQARDIPLHRRLTDQLYPLPSPPATLFYIAAREASPLNICFVIPGFRGETLEVQANNVDLAFILQQTLKKRGWGDVMTTKGVEDFLQVPMMKVAWAGEEGKFGKL